VRARVIPSAMDASRISLGTSRTHFFDRSDDQRKHNQRQGDSTRDTGEAKVH
jgi:hypothetical protein